MGVWAFGLCFQRRLGMLWGWSDWRVGHMGLVNSDIGYFEQAVQMLVRVP
jgi:hypothetical protein